MLKKQNFDLHLIVLEENTFCFHCKRKIPISSKVSKVYYFHSRYCEPTYFRGYLISRFSNSLDVVR